MASNAPVPGVLPGYPEDLAPHESSPEYTAPEEEWDIYSDSTDGSGHTTTTSIVDTLAQVYGYLSLDDGPRIDCFWVTLSRLIGVSQSELMNLNSMLHCREHGCTTVPYLIQALHELATPYGASVLPKFKYGTYGPKQCIERQWPPMSVPQARKRADRLLDRLHDWKWETEDLGACFYQDGQVGHCVVWYFDCNVFVDYQTDEQGVDVTEEVNDRGIVFLFAINRVVLRDDGFLRIADAKAEAERRKEMSYPVRRIMKATGV